MADVSFDLDEVRFHFRVGGVALRQGRVLLSNEGRADYWILPGGRVAAGERSADAVRRELREELGTEPRVVGLLWSIENFFTLDDVAFHEILFCYRVEVPGITDLAERAGLDDPRVRYIWHPVATLPALPLHPGVLRRALADRPCRRSIWSSRSTTVRSIDHEQQVGAGPAGDRRRAAPRARARPTLSPGLAWPTSALRAVPERVAEDLGDERHRVDVAPGKPEGDRLPQVLARAARPIAELVDLHAS